jgi:hypothetical protein
MRLWNASICVILLSGACASAEERIAVIKGGSICILSDGGRNVVELTADARAKRDLRWLPSGQRISYLVEDDKGAMGRLVIADLAGKPLKEVPIRPITDPPTEGLRFIEDIDWVSDSKVRVEGSVNPRNCEVFDVDLGTAEESGDHMGACGSFAPSPDGKHFAALGLESYGPTGDLADSVEVDDDRIIYTGPRPGGVKILAGPVWSEDSARISVIERSNSTGAVALSILSLDGHVERTFVAENLPASLPLSWAGQVLIVGSGDQARSFDPSSKMIGAVSPEIAAVLRGRWEAASRVGLDKARIQKIVQALGGQEGVSWTDSAPGQ